MILQEYLVMVYYTRVELPKIKQLSNGSGAGSRNTGCEDTYQYYFTAEELVKNENDAHLKYEPFTVQRRDSDSCSDSVCLDPIYETGDVVDCWRPRVPRYVPSKWYRCGNDKCIKIFAPQVDISHAESISESYRTGSNIAFRVSIPFFLIGSIGLIILRTRNSSGNGEGEHEDPDSESLSQ